MALNETQKKLLVAAGAVLLGYAGYRVIFKKDSVPEAIKKSAEAPVELAKDAIETVASIPKKLVKGSAEAKEHMKRLAHMKKGTGRRARAKAHKGHATRKGLAQDQQRASSEPWEVAYRKNRIPAR